MREITITRDIEAPQSAVWDVLADFPNISSWNSGVKHSVATSESTGGVGAARHCDLAPIGELEETVAEWAPQERLVVNIDSASKLPIRSGTVTFTLGTQGETTPTEIRYAYEPNGGRVFGPLVGAFLDRQLRTGFVGFLEDLEQAAVN